MLIESMFEPASAISDAMFASTPRWFATVTWIAAWNSRSVAGSHCTSIHWSGSLRRERAIAAQSSACTTSPVPS
jgi:hypothetical protein